MICNPCRIGGQMNKRGHSHMRQIDFSGNRIVAHLIWHEPSEAHAACSAPTTCPCQHMTGRTTIVDAQASSK